jgi:hypothetical protein
MQGWGRGRWSRKTGRLFSENLDSLGAFGDIIYKYITTVWRPEHLHTLVVLGKRWLFLYNICTVDKPRSTSGPQYKQQWCPGYHTVVIIVTVIINTPLYKRGKQTKEYSSPKVPKLSRFPPIMTFPSSL